MKQKLYAFWRYDHYPYVLGGEVEDMDNSGRVYVPSYQAWFKPIKLLPLDAGRALHDKLETLRTHYETERDKLRMKWNTELFQEMPEACDLRNQEHVKLLEQRKKG